MKFSAAVLMLLVTTSSVFAQVTAVEYLKAHPETVEQYLKQCEERKKESIDGNRKKLEKLETEMTKLKDELKSVEKVRVRVAEENEYHVKTRKLVSFKSIAAKKEKIERIRSNLADNETETQKLKAEAETLKDGQIIDRAFVGPGDKYTVGMIGRIHFDLVTVIQIFDKNNALVRLPKLSSSDILTVGWLEMPTDGLIEEKKLRTKRIFVITGTKKYTTVLNKTSTVLVLSALPEGWKWTEAVPTDSKPTTDEKGK